MNTAVKRPRQKRAIETRDRILDTAERLFDSHGYSGFAMSTLAKQAKVSIGGLYEWFPGKDAILEALVTRHIEVVGAHLIARLQQDQDQSIEARIEMVLRSALELHQATPRVHRIFYSQVPRSDEIQAQLRTVDDFMEQVMTHAFESEGIPRDEAILAAACVSRTGQALLHEFVLDDELPGDQESRLERVIKLLHDMIPS